MRAPRCPWAFDISENAGFHDGLPPVRNERSMNRATNLLPGPRVPIGVAAFFHHKVISSKSAGRACAQMCS